MGEPAKILMSVAKEVSPPAAIMLAAQIRPEVTRARAMQVGMETVPFVRMSTSAATPTTCVRHTQRALKWTTPLYVVGERP